MTFDGVDWHRSPDDDDLNMGLPEQPYGDEDTVWADPECGNEPHEDPVDPPDGDVLFFGVD